MKKKFIQYLGFNVNFYWSSYKNPDFSIYNIRFDTSDIINPHKIGIVFTFDKWCTKTRIGKAWEGKDKERIKFKVGYQSISFEKQASFYFSCPFKLWFALFVQDEQGNEWWDNNNGWNYEINQVSSIAYLRTREEEKRVEYHPCW